jgi:DNA polymerase-3 subunit epsilon
MRALARWLGLGRTAAGEARRWVVVDVETTGLDAEHDELLSVAGVALAFEAGAAAPRIRLEDSFEGVLHHESPSTDKDNILLHGIGVAAQRAGAAPREVLEAFEAWRADAPLLAFHAPFDAAMIGRAMQTHLGRALTPPWLDLAPIASMLRPEARVQGLDDWLEHFGIECPVRHQSAADALAAAELLLRLWPAARAQGCDGFEALAALARQRHWLPHGA